MEMIEEEIHKMISYIIRVSWCCPPSWIWAPPIIQNQMGR